MPRRCYVYTIGSVDQPIPPDIAGFDGAPLSAVVHGELLATTSAIASGRMQPTAKNVLIHEAVVEAMGRAGRTLPVRFGTIFPDVEAVERALRDRYDTLSADLARVGDKVEMGLTLLVEQPETPDASNELDADAESLNGGPGTRYMRARLAEQRREEGRQQRASALDDSIRQELDYCTVDHRSSIAPSPRLLLRSAYLLDASSLPAFHQTIDRIRENHDDIRFLVSGPWPPYSFVSRAVDSAEGAEPRRNAAPGRSR